MATKASSDVAGGKAEFLIYFPEKNGRRLNEEVRQITPTVDPLKAVIEEIGKGPQGKDSVAIIPRGARVKDARYEGEIVVVDIDAALARTLITGRFADRLLVQAVVCSICQNTQAAGVRFTIDGEPAVVSASSDTGIDDVVEPDYLLVSK